MALGQNKEDRRVVVQQVFYSERSKVKSSLDGQGSW